jgi:hypothetical protein
MSAANPSGRYTTNNLALLQDVIRRNPESYRDEFNQQFTHFTNLINLIELQPNFEESSIDVDELTNVVGFLSATCPCYADCVRILLCLYFISLFICVISGDIICYNIDDNITRQMSTITIHIALVVL